MYISDIPFTDGGYFTGPESFYETPDTSRTLIEENTGRNRGLEDQDQKREF
jgi:hypothetical protein